MKKIAFLVAMLSAMVGLSYAGNANASSAYYGYPHTITTKQRVRITKIRAMTPASDSYAVSSWYVKKGTTIRGVHTSAEYNWIINSNSDKYFKIIDKGPGHNWFYIGKRKVIKYRPNKRLYRKYHKLSNKYEKLSDKYLDKDTNLTNRETKLDSQENDDNFDAIESKENKLDKLDNKYEKLSDKYSKMSDHYDNLANRYK